MIIPAFSYFSMVSQEAANQLAIDEGCASSCCISPLNTIGALFFPNYLTYDSTNFLVFLASQTQGIKAIDPVTDTVVGTGFVLGTTYHGGIIYVPVTNRVYCCVQIGPNITWKVIDPVSLAVTATITPPVGYTFLPNLQPTYDPVGQRIIVAGVRTAGTLPALLQIDVNAGTAALAYLETSAFNGMDFPGAYDSTRNRFVYKINDFVGGVANLVILSDVFAVVGTVSVGAASVSGTTGDVLYVEPVDKIFYSGTTGAGNRFLQLNAATLATEFIISSVRGSIWFNEGCRIVFQNSSGTVNQWDYHNEVAMCNPVGGAFGLGATTETVTNKSYIVAQGAPGSVLSLQAPP